MLVVRELLLLLLLQLCIVTSKRGLSVRLISCSNQHLPKQSLTKTFPAKTFPYPTSTLKPLLNHFPNHSLPNRPSTPPSSPLTLLHPTPSIPTSSIPQNLLQSISFPSYLHTLHSHLLTDLATVPLFHTNKENFQFVQCIPKLNPRNHPGSPPSIYLSRTVTSSPSSKPDF